MAAQEIRVGISLERGLDLHGRRGRRMHRRAICLGRMPEHQMQEGHRQCLEVNGHQIYKERLLHRHNSVLLRNWE
jgi:hypothetical protein